MGTSIRFGAPAPAIVASIAQVAAYGSRLTAEYTVDTPTGPARIDLDRPGDARALLVLGHGAGGSVEAPDLLSVRDHCVAAGVGVARVTQPYRVAGRKAPPAAPTLDAAWLAVVAGLGGQLAAGLPQVFAGRSSGARVACRTAATADVAPIGVVALAFPVHPPGKPEKSRIGELDSVDVPVLVVQGRTDPFGIPGRRRGRRVVTVAGDHSLKQEHDQVGRAVARWLTTLLNNGK